MSLTSKVTKSVNELTYGTRLEIEHALSCRAGRILQHIESNKKWLTQCSEEFYKNAVYFSVEYPRQLDDVKSAYKEFMGREMNIESLKEIYLSE